MKLLCGCQGGLVIELPDTFVTLIDDDVGPEASGTQQDAGELFHAKFI